MLKRNLSLALNEEEKKECVRIYSSMSYKGFFQKPFMSFIL